jgi:competence ComEA-like helix-hairpin-helix protein
MRLGIISFAVIALAFSACKPQNNASNIDSSSANRPRSTSNVQSESSKLCTNLNTANANELTELEGIGEVIANRIIDYRERYGRFSRKEQVLIVEGLSEKKYRVIAAKICVD